MSLCRFALVNRQIGHRPTMQRAGPNFGAILHVRRIECRFHAHLLLGLIVLILIGSDNMSLSRCTGSMKTDLPSNGS